MTDHMMSFHRGEDPQKFIKIQILQALPDEQSAKVQEVWWQRRLFSFSPTGLNVRDESENL